MCDKGDWIVSQSMPRQDIIGTKESVFPYELYDVAYFETRTRTVIKGGVRK